MQNNTKGIICAAVAAFLWGFLAVALKLAVQMVEPVTIVWFRFAIAFIVLALWQLKKDPSLFRILVRPPILLVVAALALLWNYTAYMFGVHYTTPSNAQLFIQTGPIILAFAGIFFFNEKVSLRQLAGFVTAVVGLLLFYRDQLSAFFNQQGKYNTGVLFTISGAIAWAAYAIIQKKLLKKFPVEALNLFLFGLPVILFIPFINVVPLAGFSFKWLLLLFFLGMNTFVAYTCLAMALKYTEAGKVSVIIIVNPIITFVIMSILTELDVSWITHERFSFITIAGALLVISGAVLVAYKTKQK